MPGYYHDHTTGWICPRCKRVNAPWMPWCGCKAQPPGDVFIPWPCNGECLRTSAPCPVHKARPNEGMGDE